MNKDNPEWATKLSKKIDRAYNSFMLMEKAIREDRIRRKMLVDPVLFSKRKLTEREKQKERWERDILPLVEGQRKLIERGGLRDHIVAGQKHTIPRLGEKESRRFPRGKQYSETTQKMLDIMNKETPSSIRSMSKELQNTPFRKWTPEMMEFSRKYPDIANAIRQHQASKKKVKS